MGDQIVEEPTSQPTNAQVVLASVAAAVGIAAAAVGVGRWRSRPAEPALPEPPSLRDLTDIVKTIGREAIPAQAEAGRRWLGRGANQAKERMAARMEPGSGNLSRQGESLRRLGERKGAEVVRQAKQMRKQAPRRTEDMTSTAQAIAARAAAAAVAWAEQAWGIGASLADAARERMPEVGQRGREERMPSLREVAMQAAASALDLWESARERAGEMAGAAESEIGRTGAKATHAASAGGERVRGASAAAAERAAAVTGKAAEARDRARTATARTAVATADAGKETATALFWATAAVGLVCYGLLSPERRQQVLSLAGSAVEQGRELVRDFQGYDDEF